MIKVRIIKFLNEKAALLETRRTRDWIEQQAKKKGRLRRNYKETMMAFYNAGVQNIPDLKVMEPENPYDENLIKAIELYYSGKFKELLKSIGITQLSDFDKQGYRFIDTMNNLADYDRYEDEKAAQKKSRRL